MRRRFPRTFARRCDNALFNTVVGFLDQRFSAAGADVNLAANGDPFAGSQMRDDSRISGQSSHPANAASVSASNSWTAPAAVIDTRRTFNRARGEGGEVWR